MILLPLSCLTVYLLLLVNQQSEFKKIILTRFIKLLQTNKSITKYLVGTQTYINIYLKIQVSSIISTKQRDICLQHFFIRKDIFLQQSFIPTYVCLHYLFYFIDFIFIFISSRHLSLSSDNLNWATSKTPNTLCESKFGIQVFNSPLA